MFPELNNIILKQASKLKWRPAEYAPGDMRSVFSQNGLKLVVWTGASENTIWGDARVNWAFRALHDNLHIKSRLGLTIEEEIELGRLQASQYSGILADIVYLEVAGQAKYFKEHGIFVIDQAGFIKSQLKGFRL